MKKTKLLSLTALTLIGLLGLSSCSGTPGEKGDKGDPGEQGETGEKGDKGDPGEDGKDGEDGSVWLTGTGAPTSTLGKEGDMYLNTSNGDVYQKEADGRKLKMNIQGEDGADGNLTLEGVVLNTDASGVGVIEGRGNILIKDSTINAKVFGLSTNAGGDNKKVNIVIDHSKLITTEKGGFSGTDNDSTGLLVNIPTANVTVRNNSVITGLRQAVIVRGGTATIENSTIEWANSYNGSSDNRYHFGYSSGNEVANSAIVIGDDDSNNTNYGLEAELTLTGVTYKYTNSDAAGTQSLNEVLPLEENSTEPEYYEIFVGCASGKEAILNIDTSTYNQFDKEKITKKGEGTTEINIIDLEEQNNVFVNGQLYSKAYFDKNGSFIEDVSIKEGSVSFSGGNGTQEQPLVVKTSEDLLMINKLIEAGYDKEETLFVKVDDSVSSLLVIEPVNISSSLNIEIDFNNKSIVLGKTALFELTNDSKLKITGDPTFSLVLESGNENAHKIGYYFRLNDNSSITIDSGTYESCMTVVQLNGNSTGYITGGNF